MIKSLNQWILYAAIVSAMVVVVYLLIFAPSIVKVFAAKDDGDFYGVIVESCYDGDTCNVIIPYLPPPFTKQTVRFKGIDTAEKHGECPQEIELATKAQMATSGWINQAKRIDLRHVTHGIYGRIVAEVWLNGDKSLNELLLRSKLAVKSEGKRTQDWCLPLKEIFP